MAVEISKALDKAYLSTQLSNHEKYMLYDEKTKPDGTKYLRRRYRKLDETFEYTVDTQYYIGNLVTYQDCLYAAIVDNYDAAWDPTHWKMVGAKSIIQIFKDALPNPADLKEDTLIVLKADEVDGTGAVVHKKGMWVFDATTGAYYMFDEHESTDLDLSEMFDSTATSIYKGAEKTIDSAYLYKQLGSAVIPLKEKIDELFDIAKDAEYIIVDDEVALKAYDLTTLKANTMNIFLVKEDHDHLVDPTDPDSAPTATLYGCVAVIPASDRKLDYIGQLSMSAEATKKLIQDMIDEEVKITVPAHYENCDPSTTGALVIVADGTLTDPDTEIEESNVNPVSAGTDTSIGQYVVFVDERISSEYKFMEKKDYDTETLQKVSHSETIYTDPEGIEADVTIDYLTYENVQLMRNIFEDRDIDFNDPADFTPVIP